MFFHHQFDNFPPLDGHVPANPVPALPDIAQRARVILRKRTEEQFFAIARRINSELNGYFNEQMGLAIIEIYEKLWAGMGEEDDFFEPVRLSEKEIPEVIIKRDVLDKLDVDTPENMSPVKALKKVIQMRGHWFYGSQQPGEVDEFSEGTDHEFFACLAICLVSRCLATISTDNSSQSTFHAASYAVQATDSVCYAEQLIEINSLIEMLNQEAQERILAERRERTKKASEGRHEDTYKIMQLILAEWERDPSAFPSAEKASKFFSNWLEINGYKSFEPRTIASWIRNYAKQKGIKLR